MNADLIVSLLIAGLNHANALAQLLQAAKARGTDVTDAEVQSLSADLASRIQTIEDHLKAKGVTP